MFKLLSVIALTYAFFKLLFPKKSVNSISHQQQEPKVIDVDYEEVEE